MDFAMFRSSHTEKHSLEFYQFQCGIFIEIFVKLLFGICDIFDTMAAE